MMRHDETKRIIDNRYEISSSDNVLLWSVFSFRYFHFGHFHSSGPISRFTDRIDFKLILIESVVNSLSVKAITIVIGQFWDELDHILGLSEVQLYLEISLIST